MSSSINLSFKLSKNDFEPYLTLKSALFIVNFSLSKIVIPPKLDSLAGMVMLFVVSFNVKFPVT